jgi:hypothetical protein
VIDSAGAEGIVDGVGRSDRVRERRDGQRHGDQEKEHCNYSDLHDLSPFDLYRLCLLISLIFPADQAGNAAVVFPLRLMLSEYETSFR